MIDSDDFERRIGPAIAKLNNEPALARTLLLQDPFPYELLAGFVDSFGATAVTTDWVAEALAPAFEFADAVPIEVGVQLFANAIRVRSWFFQHLPHSSTGAVPSPVVEKAIRFIGTLPTQLEIPQHRYNGGIGDPRIHAIAEDLHSRGLPIRVPKEQEHTIGEVASAVIFAAGVAAVCLQMLQDGYTGLQWIDDDESLPVLHIVDSLSVPDLHVANVTTEELRRIVMLHLQSDTWSVEGGSPFGLEEEIQQDLNELNRELRPLTDRPSNSAIIQIHVGRLSSRLLDLAAKQARVDQIAFIDEIRSNTVDAISQITKGQPDVLRAYDAVRQLAIVANWEMLPLPADVDQSGWNAFVDDASKDPVRTAIQIMRWTPSTRQELAGGALGGLTGTGGFGLFAQAITAWAQTASGTGGAITTMAGLVGTVVGAVLGVISVRFQTQVPVGDATTLNVDNSEAPRKPNSD